MISESVQIYIKDKGYLDVSDSFPFALTFGVADIRDTNKRQGSSSKTLSLPGTKNNHSIFGDLFNVRISDFTFNLNTKYEAAVIKNGQTVFNGYITLRDIVKNPTNNIYDEDCDIIYNVVMYDSVVDFFTTIDPLSLEDIEFNVPDHNLTTNDIIATKNNTYLDVYKYFNLMKPSGVNYSQTDFWPAIFAKSYFDRIINDAGFHYSKTESNFLESDDFKKLVIPFAGKGINDPLLWSKELFYGAKTGDTVYDFEKFYNQNLYTYIAFNDYYSFPYFKNEYNEPVDEIYTPNYGGRQGFTFTLKGKLKYSASTDCWYAGGISGLAPSEVGATARYRNLPIIGYFNKNTINILSQTVYNNNVKYQALDNADLNTPDLEAGVVYEDSFDVTVSFPDKTLIAGDKIKMNYFIKVFGNSDYYQTTGTTNAFGKITFAGVTKENVKCHLTIEEAKWWNNPVNSIERRRNDLIKLQNYIPRNVKQKQFVGDISRMFNLFIDTDKDNTGRLVIKNRDDYYSTDVRKDWSLKTDKTKEIKIQYLPELQKKETILTYKKNDEELSKKYFDFYNETYGQKKIIYNTETVIGEEKKEINFTECPTVSWYGLTLPAINSEKPSKLSILFDNGMKNGSWNLGSANYSEYMCASHWDDIDEPSADLNFGFNKSYFKEQPYTQNNLFNIYHYNTFKQISEQRMVTMYMWLTETDMANLKLSDKIIIDGVEYIINQIYDYNPTANESTKIDFLKWDRVYEKRPAKRKPVWGGTIIEGIGVPLVPIVITPRPPVGIINDVEVNDIKPGVTSSFIFGRDNTVEVSDGNFIVGNDNVLYSNQNNITLINSNKNYIGGDSTQPYTASTYSNITLINTDNVTFSGESSATTLENVVLVGVTQEEVDNATDNTFVVGENIQMIYHGDTIEQYITNTVVSGSTLSGNSYVFVPAREDYATNGTELLNAYSEARGRVTGGTVPNCTVLLAPGLYMLPSQLVMDTNNVYLCGLSTKQNTIISGNTIFINDNVLTYLENIWNPLSAGIHFYTMNSGTTIKNCDSGNASFGYLRGYTTAYTVDVRGTFIDCVAGIRSFGHYGEASGTFTNCIAGYESFGWIGEASGTFIDCVAGICSFGSSATTAYTSNASGVFVNCKAGDRSFGYFSEASGVFRDCTSGEKSFGYNSEASGSFTNCVSTAGLSFGCIGNASGTFRGCTSHSDSFGYYGDASGVFTDCITLSGYSFGCIGNASGTFRGCKSDYLSFGVSSTGTGHTGYFSHCIGGTNSFGSNTGFSGTTEYCVAGANSFGGTGRTGTVLYSRMTSGTFDTMTATGIVRMSLDGSLNEINLN